MIKPHIVMGRNVGQVITAIEEGGFSILLAKMIQLRSEGAEEFYKEHEGKDFFPNLINVMTTGPVWVMVVSHENAVDEWRNFIGATNPAEAEPDTLRARFGDHENLTNNAVHGSATDHDAQREIGFFFGREITLAEKIDAIDNGREVS